MNRAQVLLSILIWAALTTTTRAAETRVLVDFQVDKITTVYLESHPILSVGEPDDVRCYDIFTKMFETRDA